MSTIETFTFEEIVEQLDDSFLVPLWIFLGGDVIYSPNAFQVQVKVGRPGETVKVPSAEFRIRGGTRAEGIFASFYEDLSYPKEFFGLTSGRRTVIPHLKAGDVVNAADLYWTW
jgi:hypothetical protein